MMFSYLSVPKVLILFSFFTFSIDPFQVFNSLLSHSCCKLLHPLSEKAVCRLENEYHG